MYHHYYRHRPYHHRVHHPHHPHGPHLHPEVPENDHYGWVFATAVVLLLLLAVAVF